jgi:hypothetical protein
MKNVLDVLVAAIILAGTTSARGGQKPTVREMSMDLAYKLGPGTETCYAPRGMEQLIMGALTYDPFGREPNPELHVGIDVVHEKGKFHAELTMTLADGTRLWVEELSNPDCVELLGNVSVIVSGQVLLHVIQWPEKTPPPASSAPPTEAPPASPPPPAPPPAPPPSVATAAPPPVTRPDPWRRQGVLGAELSLGLVPGFGVGASAGVGLQWRELLSLNVDVRGLISPAPVDVSDHISGRWYFLGASLAPCIHGEKTFACLAMHAGARGGLAPGVPSTRNELQATTALGLRLGAVKKVGHGYSLRAGIDLGYRLPQRKAAGYDQKQEASDATIPFLAIAHIGLSAAP